MKKIIIESFADPTVPGYPDRVAVFNAESAVIYHGAASACPNHRAPVKAGETARDACTWGELYGWLACGLYEYECVHHQNDVSGVSYGKCLILNNGKQMPSRTPNPRHEWKRIISQVFVHSGQTAAWRGSAGCITIPPDDWSAFMDCFAEGETGEIAVVDFSKGKNIV